MELKKNIAYLLLHFPYLTETFVAEEIRVIRELGFNVHIISLLEAGDGPIQPASEELLRFTWYSPGIISLYSLRSVLYYLLKSPRKFLKLVIDILSQPYNMDISLFFKRGVIFIKAANAAFYLKDKNVTGIHSHFAWLSGAATYICSALLKIPFTVTTHAYDIFASNDLLPLVCKKAIHVVTISEYNKRYLMDQVEIPSSKISVIHCGVKSSNLDNPFIKKGTTSEKAIKYLSVGSLITKKGHNYLIDACDHLKQRGIDFVCNIVGTGPDHNDLQNQINEHGLQNQVNLLGAMLSGDLKFEFNNHDVFVLASVRSNLGDQDGIPVVLMEAGAAGLPLISTNISGIPEIVVDGKTGIMVEPEDSLALADAMQKLANNPDLRDFYGQNALELVRAEYLSVNNAIVLAKMFDSLFVQA